VLWAFVRVKDKHLPAVLSLDVIEVEHACLYSRTLEGDAACDNHSTALRDGCGLEAKPELAEVILAIVAD
jgi:hypothetical protein